MATPIELWSAPFAGAEDPEPAPDLQRFNEVSFRTKLDALLAAGYALPPQPRTRSVATPPKPDEPMPSLTVSDMMGGPELQF